MAHRIGLLLLTQAMIVILGLTLGGAIDAQLAQRQLHVYNAQSHSEYRADVLEPLPILISEGAK